MTLAGNHRRKTALLLAALGVCLCCRAACAQGDPEPLPPTLDVEAPFDPRSGSVVDQMPAEFEHTHLGAMTDCDRAWQWQLLPGSIIYQSYLAGAKESRFSSVWAHDKYEGWIWDITLGGRVGLLRYGTPGTQRPEGWQFDMEGAASPRLDLEHYEDLMATDYRFGAPLTYGYGAYQTKVAVYHLSSHIGDEYLLLNPTFTRINYSRNALVWGNAYFLNDDTRMYAEAEWAFDKDVGQPWAFQFGVDYSPVRSGRKVSAPFAAINGHLREEVDFGGNLVAQAGWQWRPQGEGRLLRAGVQYYVGKSDQFEFFDVDESKIGLGLWYDY